MYSVSPNEVLLGSVSSGLWACNGCTDVSNTIEDTRLGFYNKNNGIVVQDTYTIERKQCDTSRGCLPTSRHSGGCLTVTESGDRRPTVKCALMQDRAGVTKNTLLPFFDHPPSTRSRVRDHRGCSGV